MACTKVTLLSVNRFPSHFWSSVVHAHLHLRPCDQRGAGVAAGGPDLPSIRHAVGACHGGNPLRTAARPGRPASLLSVRAAAAAKQDTAVPRRGGHEERRTLPPTRVRAEPQLPHDGKSAEHNRADAPEYESSDILVKVRRGLNGSCASNGTLWSRTDSRWVASSPRLSM